MTGRKSDTRPEDLQKCTLCDAMVDPAFLGDVWFHFVDGGCINPDAERNAALDAIRGEKARSDA